MYTLDLIGVTWAANLLWKAGVFGVFLVLATAVVLVGTLRGLWVAAGR